MGLKWQYIISYKADVGGEAAMRKTLLLFKGTFGDKQNIKQTYYLGNLEAHETTTQTARKKRWQFCVVFFPFI